MEFNIPQSLKLEHEELHAELTRATQVSGKIGDCETNYIEANYV